MSGKIAKKYLLIIYLNINLEEILEKLFHHMPDGGLYNTMKIKEVSMISFYSEDRLLDIKETMFEMFKTPPLFFIFDISDKQREKTFEMWFDSIENRVVLDFIPIDENTELTIDIIIELINTNGYDSLTERQLKFLEEYTK